MFTYPKSNDSEENKDMAPIPAPFTPFGEASPEMNYDAPEPIIPSAASAMGSRNVLNSDVSVKGILRFSEALLVDGVVEGQITSDGALSVGSNASITAGKDDKVAIRTQSVLIEGKVTGNIEVTDFVELAPTAELVGDIVAKRLIIKDGAVFIGHSAVGVASTNPILASSPSKTSTDKKAKAAPLADANALDLKN